MRPKGNGSLQNWPKFGFYYHNKFINTALISPWLSAMCYIRFVLCVIHLHNDCIHCDCVCCVRYNIRLHLYEPLHNLVLHPLSAAPDISHQQVL